MLQISLQYEWSQTILKLSILIHSHDLYVVKMHDYFEAFLFELQGCYNYCFRKNECVFIDNLNNVPRIKY